MQRKLAFFITGIAVGYASFIGLSHWMRGFLPTPLLLILSVAVPTAAVYAVFRFWSSGNPTLRRWGAILQLGQVWTRFWLGVVLPTVLLTLLIVLVIATGRGKESAPMALFFASMVALPGTMLCNCWVLFISWRSKVRLFLGGLAFPALVGFGSALLVHGTGHGQELGVLVLYPFFLVPVVGGPGRPQAALTLWALAMIAVVVAARVVSTRNSDRR
jgi:hypothetical protein